MSTRAIICFDMDAFFCQVERSLEPSLVGKPMAVQQHRDIISVSHNARSLGVKKHMAPEVIRKDFPSVRIVHTLILDGGKVSYKHYRRASARILHTLKKSKHVVSRGRFGLDEFFADVTVAAAKLAAANRSNTSRPAEGAIVLGQKSHRTGRRGAASRPSFDSPASPPQSSAESGSSPSRPFSSPPGPTGARNRACTELELLVAASHIAQSMRETLLRETGFTSSCGVAGNILLAKFACVAAKPDGLGILAHCYADTVLQPSLMPLARIPGCGGRSGSIAARLHNAHGVDTVLQAREVPLGDLRSTLGEARARQVHDACRWIDNEKVVPRGPPAVVASQMALTPFVALNSLPAGSKDADGSSGGSADAVLSLFQGFRPPPLHRCQTVSGGHSTGAAVNWHLPVAPWDWDSVRRLVRVLALDLAARALHEAEENLRWPQKLVVGVSLLEAVPPSRVRGWRIGEAAQRLVQELTEGELPGFHGRLQCQAAASKDATGTASPSAAQRVCSQECSGAVVRWVERLGPGPIQPQPDADLPPLGGASDGRVVVYRRRPILVDKPRASGATASASADVWHGTVASKPTASSSSVSLSAGGGPSHRERGPMVSTTAFPTRRVALRRASAAEATTAASAAAPLEQPCSDSAVVEALAQLITASARPAYHAACVKVADSLDWGWSGGLSLSGKGVAEDDAGTAGMAGAAAARSATLQERAVASGTRLDDYTMPICLVSIKLAAAGFVPLTGALDQHLQITEAPADAATKRPRAVAASDGTGRAAGAGSDDDASSVDVDLTDAATVEAEADMQASKRLMAALAASKSTWWGPDAHPGSGLEHTGIHHGLPKPEAEAAPATATATALAKLDSETSCAQLISCMPGYLTRWV
jgi:nucleotidyltransferase/DNA polymerase involved in DNA repair